MMDQLIERFPSQLIEALEIGEAATINAHSEKIDKVFGEFLIISSFIFPFLYV